MINLRTGERSSRTLLSIVDYAGTVHHMLDPVDVIDSVAVSSSAAGFSSAAAGASASSDLQEQCTRSRIPTEAGTSKQAASNLIWRCVFVC